MSSTDRRTAGRTDGQTDGQGESSIPPPTSLGGGIKTNLVTYHKRPLEFIWQIQRNGVIQPLSDRREYCKKCDKSTAWIFTTLVTSFSRMWSGACPSCVYPYSYPDGKICEAYIGPTWGRQDPCVPHVGPMNLALRVELYFDWISYSNSMLKSPVWRIHAVSICAHPLAN